MLFPIDHHLPEIPWNANQYCDTFVVEGESKAIGREGGATQGGGQHQGKWAKLFCLLPSLQLVCEQTKYTEKENNIDLVELILSGGQLDIFGKVLAKVLVALYSG